MERTVLVQGHAEVRVPPDRALVWVTIDADGTSRDDAYRAAVQSADGVDAVITAHGATIGRAVTATLSVQPLTRWKKGESVRTGWRATRRTTIEVVSFERLGELLADLARWATIAGPTWQVDPTNPGYLDARRGASEDARRRAESYAAGLGVTIAGVAWIAEPGLRTSDGHGMGGTMAFAAAPAPQMRSRGGAVPEDEPIIDVQPEETVITASVDVAFTLAD